MKTISKFGYLIMLCLSISISYGQIKNASTEQVSVFGNCEMCKETIEKAGNLKKMAKVDWNEETKMASITYNSKLTNKDAILKRIALAGYDNESYLAPDLAYSKLMECCKYERKAKKMPLKLVNVAEIAQNSTPITDNVKISQMQLVFNDYFKVKNALVNTDANAASAQSMELVKSLSAIKMNELDNETHMVWMKVMKELIAEAKLMANSKKIDFQREHFIPLTKNIYALMKVTKTENPIYYQYCPMANDGNGANWLSQEKEVRNPYFGSEMMNCGKVVETIK